MAMDDKGTLAPSSVRTGYRASAAWCKLLFELLVRLVLLRSVKPRDNEAVS